jgi:hypothetical protein
LLCFGVVLAILPPGQHQEMGYLWVAAPPSEHPAKKRKSKGDAPMHSIENNKRIGCQWLELISTHDIEAI